MLRIHSIRFGHVKSHGNANRTNTLRLRKQQQQQQHVVGVNTEVGAWHVLKDQCNAVQAVE